MKSATKILCAASIIITAHLITSCRGTARLEQPVEPPGPSSGLSAPREPGSNIPAPNTPPAGIPGTTPDLIRDSTGTYLSQQENAPLKPRTTDYFPLSEGNEWLYSSNLGEYSFTVSKGNLPDEYICTSRVKGAEAEAFLIIESSAIVCRKQKMKIFLMKDETLYKPYLTRYPKPMEKGVKFSWHGTKNQGNMPVKAKLYGEISESTSTVETAAGVFECLRLDASYICEDGTQQHFTQWFSPGVGLVKMVSRIEGERKGMLGHLQKVFKARALNIELKSYKIK